MGESDWRRCSDENGEELSHLWSLAANQRDETDLHWDKERYELTLQPRLFQFSPATNDRSPAFSDRRGAARDRFSNWYWIDRTSNEIEVLSSGTGNASHFWSAQDCGKCERETDNGNFHSRELRGPIALIEMRGLAVTEDHYLVVGTLRPAGLLIFDLAAGGAPSQVLWPADTKFAPFDMSPRPGGGVWILDRDFSNEIRPARLWALDRHFNLIAQDQQEATITEEELDDFQPKDSGEIRRTPAQTFPRGISLDFASPLDGIDAIAVESLPDGSVLLLDRSEDEGFARIHRYRFGREFDSVSTVALRELIEEDKKSDFKLIAHDFAFVPAHEEEEGHVADRLYIVGADGNQAFAFNISLEEGRLKIDPLELYFPLRLFSGKALVAAGGQAHYDLGNSWIPLVEQRRPRYKTDAILITPLFDGQEPDCRWHRLILDACIPPDASVEVWSRAARTEEELLASAWQREPDLYLRGDGSELPFVSKVTGEGNGSWELLFQKASGRYLQLRLELAGNGRVTPRLRALRSYYPRFSYAENYLPAVYQQDAESASFLDRFLSNLEGFYTAIEDKIALIQLLFDPRSAPADALEWLALWFDAALDPAWDESRRRLFISHAVDFFQYRGTIRGLRMALRLALEDCVDQSLFDEKEADTLRPGSIRIVEHFRSRHTPGIVFGDPAQFESGPRLVEQTERWRPEQGRDQLHSLYAEAPGVEDHKEFSIHNPGGAEAALWQEFSLRTLGFIPSASTEERLRWQNFLAGHYVSITQLNSAHAANWPSFDTVPLPADMPARDAIARDWLDFLRSSTGRSGLNRKLWQNFLSRRYRVIEALGQAHGVGWISFDVISLTDELPRDGAPLLDWYQFESVVLAMLDAAHRFTVALPVPRSEPPHSLQYQRRFDLAHRLIEMEKPAHTVFDVKFFWAMFRVGFARLGEDTLIEQGSRAPQLLSTMTLGKGHLAESYLGYTLKEAEIHRQPSGYARCGRC